jgi:hypothetical protein
MRRALTRASAALALGATSTLWLGTGLAVAQSSDAGTSPVQAPATDDASAPDSVHGCVESLAKGAGRPVMSEDLPRHGTSGWAATLTLTIRHGRGEHVLPNGLELQRASDAEKELKAAGFAFPEQDGGTAAAKVTVLPEDPARKEIVTTVLEIPFVLLPEKPGRNTLVLPRLPVAVARANGDISTVCTHPHTIAVEDPISDTPDAQPKPNPPPRPQREEWKEAKLAAMFVGAGLVLGLIAAYAYRRWKNRPRPVPPPPPPRPPWELALERLYDVRHAGLLETERQSEFCDRVSDALREYLGAKLGFDGLESTTDEIAAQLAKGTLGETESARVLSVLRECDLVKFAKFTPQAAACVAMLDSAEEHVRRTMPRKPDPASRARKPVEPRPELRDDASEDGEGEGDASEAEPSDVPATEKSTSPTVPATIPEARGKGTGSARADGETDREEDADDDSSEEPPR